MPVREWDRMTELVRMFIATGWMKPPVRAQSLILISEPGQGKSELLDRFQYNAHVSYASDLTVQGLYPILKQMQRGAVTHVVATEFQKFFARKASTAENTLGTLCQMMEEGVRVVRVGNKEVDFGGAQGGIIGAMTHKTVDKWMDRLAEFGFWSRCAAFQWNLSTEELLKVMRAISDGDKSDLAMVMMEVPRERIYVDFPGPLSRQFEEYVRARLMTHTLLRVFLRLRTLAMGCALLDGRDVVHARDVEKVAAYDPYWSRMIKG